MNCVKIILKTKEKKQQKTEKDIKSIFNDKIIWNERAHSDLIYKYMCMSNKLGYFSRRIYHDDLHFHYVVFYFNNYKQFFYKQSRKWYLIYFTVMSKINNIKIKTIAIFSS